MLDIVNHIIGESVIPSCPNRFFVVKHNRKPAMGIAFDSPNLPTLIEQIIALGTSADEARR
jgi:hypothetical protein